jgi:glutathionylspermidine synthase
VAITNEALRLIERTLDQMVATKEHLPALPADILQRACDSWKTHREMTVYSRMDFGFDGKTDKLLNVGLDSLSCALICPLQDSWTVKALGQEPPFSLSQYKGDLERTWRAILKETGAKTIYFVATSDNDEQQYNALALYETTTRSGLPCEWLALDAITVSADDLRAPDGAKIQLIFKTCPWSSVFSDLGSLRARVLLHRSVLVLEPLWKALLGDDFLSLLHHRNPSSELLLAEGEVFNFQEPSVGRYPALGVVLIGGSRSASLCKDSLDDTLSSQGPFGPLWFDIHDRA